MTPAEHRIRLHKVQVPYRVPTSWWASCTGCGWIYGLSNDEDVLIDAHEAHRKEQP